MENNLSERNPILVTWWSRVWHLSQIEKTEFQIRSTYPWVARTPRRLKPTYRRVTMLIPVREWDTWHRRLSCILIKGNCAIRLYLSGGTWMLSHRPAHAHERQALGRPLVTTKKKNALHIQLGSSIEKSGFFFLFHSRTLYTSLQPNFALTPLSRQVPKGTVLTGRLCGAIFFSFLLPHHQPVSHVHIGPWRLFGG